MTDAARILTFLLLLGGSAPAAQAQIDTGAMGTRYRDDADVAAGHLVRGLRAKAKAEKEQDAARKAKLYERARRELLKSVGLNASYDALLALGQVCLALKQESSAFDACSQALQFRPDDEAARNCRDAAKKAGARATGPVPASPESLARMPADQADRCHDDFDPLLSVVGMLQPLRSGQPLEPPTATTSQKVEGWIPGL